MDPVLSAVLGSMHADISRMDRVAMNIANAHTPGYKRELDAPSFAFRVNATEAVHIDTRPGTLKRTGQELDFALSGPGWFEVMTSQGPAYTRLGNFRLDAGGRLVTGHGLPVMGVGGEIVLQSAAPVADGAGRLFDPTSPRAAQAPLAQLKVVQFDAGAGMQRLGDGLLASPSAPVLAADGAVQVQQGFLENSNVSSMREMVRLMETVRHLETLQKVTLGYDEMLGLSVRKLGESP